MDNMDNRVYRDDDRVYRDHQKPNKALQTTGRIVSIIQAAASVILIILLKRANLLPSKMMLAGIIVLAALFLLTRLMMGAGRKKGRFVAGVIIAALVVAGTLGAGRYVSQVTNTLQEITTVDYESSNVGVYVLKDDPAQTIQDAKGYSFGIMKSHGTEETQNAIAQINEELGAQITTTSYEGVRETADQLLEQHCKAVIMPDAFIEMLADSEDYADFDDQIRQIASYEIRSEVETADVDVKNPQGIFTMYISGIDTFGRISTRSRSDVNILATVNTYTGEVLLVSTPRDYYVPLSISDGQKDKLTHAGIYGINVSKETMEMIYDTDIDYYFRINFTGFEELIDALGGVDVYSEYPFDVEPSFHYVEGVNHLSGIEALAFARERHAFAEGDRQRGENQMAVITAVINKMQSPAVLNDFNGLMSGLEGSFETDMPYQVMTNMVKNQISSGTQWNTVSYSVDGTGTSATTWSMNQKLYVMEPDQASIDKAKALMEAVKNQDKNAAEETMQQILSENP